MSRYIDADSFFEEFKELDKEPYNNYPAADVVEVGERYYFKDGYRYEISTEGWLKVCRPERADICRIFRSLR